MGRKRLAKFPEIADKQRRAYAAMLLAMDENIGRVRKKLAETGLEQTTFVVFISDNGGPTMPGTTINGSRNDPLRGSKRTTLKGGIRVPFLVAWPGRLKPGVHDQPVIQLDASATALAVGCGQPDNLDGTNLWPYLSGEKSGPPHDALYSTGAWASRWPFASATTNSFATTAMPIPALDVAANP